MPETNDLAGGFTSIDDMADKNAFIEYLKLIDSLAYFQEYKQRSFELLQIREGSSVLEVGCGLGYDAVAIAELVGKSGSVVAVDASRIMIDQAEKRLENLNLPITFQTGDAHQLSFEEGSFDAARIDRVLQHVPDPCTVIREMTRVLRPGGKAVAIEPDWETFTISSADKITTRSLVNFFSDRFENGTIGRHLYSYFGDAGLTNIEIFPETLIITDLTLADRLFDIINTTRQATEAGIVMGCDAKGWLDELRESDANNRFFCSYTGFLVCGTKEE